MKIRKILIAILLSTMWVANAAAQNRISATEDVIAYVAPPNCAGGYYGSTLVPVTACGNDATADGSSALPYATLQAAIDYFDQNYDFRGKYAPFIKVASHAWPDPFKYAGVMISNRFVGQPGGIPPLIYGDGTPPFVIGNYKPIVIQGDPDHPFNAIINPGTDDRPAQIALSLAGDARVQVRGIAFDTTYATADNIDVFGASTLDLADVGFGNASNDLKRIHIGVAWGGTLMINGLVSIAGHASSFIETGSNGTVYWNNNGNPLTPMKVCIMGMPQFGNGMFNSNNGPLTVAGVTFPKCHVADDGTIVDDGGRGQVQGTVAVSKYLGVIDTATGTSAPGRTCNPDYFPQNIVPGGVQVDVQDSAICR